MFVVPVAPKIVSASVATTSVVIMPENPSRRAVIFYNNSANSVYITLGSVSSSTSCTFILATFAQLVWPFPHIIYTGPISAIRNAGTGSVVCTELLSTMT